MKAGGLENFSKVNKRGTIIWYSRVSYTPRGNQHCGNGVAKQFFFQLRALYYRYTDIMASFLSHLKTFRNNSPLQQTKRHIFRL